jgi:hypothetical protein
MLVKTFVGIVEKIARSYIFTHKKNKKYLNVECSS